MGTKRVVLQEQRGQIRYLHVAHIAYISHVKIGPLGAILDD